MDASFGAPHGAGRRSEAALAARRGDTVVRAPSRRAVSRRLRHLGLGARRSRGAPICWRSPRWVLVLGAAAVPLLMAVPPAAGSAAAHGLDHRPPAAVTARDLVARSAHRPRHVHVRHHRRRKVRRALPTARTDRSSRRFAATTASVTPPIAPTRIILGRASRAGGHGAAGGDEPRIEALVPPPPAPVAGSPTVERRSSLAAGPVARSTGERFRRGLNLPI